MFQRTKDPTALEPGTLIFANWDLTERNHKPLTPLSAFWYMRLTERTKDRPATSLFIRKGEGMSISREFSHTHTHYANEDYWFVWQKEQNET